MGLLKMVAAIGVAIWVACSPGPVPAVPEPPPDYQKDWFPSDSDGPRPIDVALQANQIEEVRKLLEGGTDPNARWLTSGDRLPIQEVLESSSYGYGISPAAEFIRLLLKHGADANAKWCPFESRGPSLNAGPSCTSATAMTPLIFATFTGSREIVEMLLEAGADPRQRDWSGASALDYAYDEVIFELISRTMFPDVSTRDQKALKWISNNQGSPYDNSLWRETPITRALTQREGVVFPAPPPPPPQASLLFGVERESRVLSRLLALLRIGADPNQRLTIDGVDSTPLSLALQSNQYRAARVLLKNKADVNQRWCVQFENRAFKQIRSRDPACALANGITPLMWSALADRAEAVALLLEFNADRSLKDWAGRSALDYSKDEVVRKLLSAH
jgi:ankyrin repeat protein